jgi:hypothetical protein
MIGLMFSHEYSSSWRFFNWAQRHEGVLGVWRYSYTHSLTLALGGGEWSASRPGCSSWRMWMFKFKFK